MAVLSTFVRPDVLVIGTPERYVLFDAHNLDVVQVFRRAPYDTMHRVYFTLLDDPALRLGHDSARRPFGKGSLLQDEPRSDKRP